MRFTIGTKIFSITLCLLVLMAVVCGISTRLTSRESLRLTMVADGFRPLDDSVVDYRRAALRRQVAFAKLLRLLDTKSALDPKVVENRKLFESEAIEARRLLDQARDQAAELSKWEMLVRERDELTRLRASLDELLVLSRNNLDYAQRLIDAMERGDTAAIAKLAPLSAKAEKDMLEAGFKNVETARETLKTVLLDVVGEQSRIVRLSYLTTAIAGVLGVILSVLIIRSLVRPVSNLMQGVHDIQGGNLSVDIAVSSSDEIGALTSSFNRMLGELRAKEKLKITFGKYVDPRVVETMLAKGGGLEVGRREEMSVIFSELVGLSDVSDQLTPSEHVNVMNHYLTMMSAPIRAHKGLIDKYIGDIIMAFWGPPFTQREEHARLACYAALEQRSALEELRKQLPALMSLRKDIPSIDFCIGIATGEVVVGNIGSELTRAFTVLGDTVNLGSRLEGANKQYGTQVLISGETELMARGAVETREIDVIAVKGKTDPIHIFELLCRAGELDETRSKLKESFEQGLERYRARDWKDADALFRRCLQILPGDGPSAVYVQRVEAFLLNPPEQNWDGVWRLSSK